MRKILITLALLFTFHFAYGKEVKASTYNLLDLENLQGTMDKLETIEPIRIITGKTYTLIFSERFSYKIDSEIRNQDQATIELVFDGNTIKDFLWKVKQFDDFYIIYYEFVAPSNELGIRKIDYDGFFPEVLLMEGNVTRFSGFYFYGEAIGKVIEETITYEEVDSYSPDVYYYMNNLQTLKVPTLIQNDLEKGLGGYDLVYMAIENNKRYYLNINVTVIDDLPPILLTGGLSYQFDQKPNLEQVLSDLNIVDNTTEINRSHIEVIVDNLSDANRPGTYDIVIKITDDSNNFAEETVSVSLLSDGKLTFIGPMTHFYYKTKKLASIEDIISQYKAYDPYTNLELDIEVVSSSYNGPGTTPGNKSIKIQIVDSTGVVHIKYITVIVIDDSRPIFVYNNIYITLNLKQDYSDSEIIDLISEQLDEKKIVYYNLSFTKDELNENKLNITYVNESDETVYDFVMIDYLDNDKSTIIIALSIGLAGSIMVIYLAINNRKKKKKIKG